MTKITQGGREGVCRDTMYAALREYYRTIDDVPEPYRSQSLTAVRAMLTYMEDVQETILRIRRDLANINM